jgi:hypothetical protein
MDDMAWVMRACLEQVATLTAAVKAFGGDELSGP